MSKILLSIKGVSKRYPKGKLALNGVTLDIFHSETIALLGVNGAGKTTLSSILATLFPPTSGDVLWNGKSIYKDLYAFRQMVGFCPQKPNLDKELTLEENLIFAGRLYGMNQKQAKNRTDEMMERFHLSSYRKSKAHVLSGGYRQRFLIARSLMRSPKFILLDEPTVGLDAHIRRKLWKVIQDLKKEGVTVLLTTHYLDEAEKLSDRVVMIHEGRITHIDTPAGLKKSYHKANLEDVFLALMKENEEQDEYN